MVFDLCAVLLPSDRNMFCLFWLTYLLFLMPTLRAGQYSMPSVFNGVAESIKRLKLGSSFIFAPLDI